MKNQYEVMKSGHCQQCNERRSVIGSSKGQLGCILIILAPFTFGLSLLGLVLLLVPTAWRCATCGSKRITKVE